jgi:hypothetical protein
LSFDKKIGSRSEDQEAKREQSPKGTSEDKVIEPKSHWMFEFISISWTKGRAAEEEEEEIE